MLNTLIILAIATTNPNEAVFKLYEGNRLLDEGKVENAAALVTPLHFYPYQPLKKFQNILKARALLLTSPEEALVLLKKAESSNAPWNEAVKYAEVWATLLNGDRKLALELLQAKGTSSQLDLLKAKLLLALEQPEEGLSVLENIKSDNEEWNDPTELLLVKTLLLREKGDPSAAIQLLQTINIENIKGYYSDYLYLVLGKLFFEQNQNEEAQNQWNQLLQKFPHSPYRPDALYWIARARENNHDDPKEIGIIHRELTTKYPDFSYADEVYFNQYSFKEYLQGDREAVTHLDKFVKLHPKSPLTIVAYYLIGLDKQQDRRSPEGKSIRKKNIKEAINAFEAAQKKYLSLNPPEAYYLHVKNLSALEHGRLLFQVANESSGPKMDIYRHYALDVLIPLINEEREISSQAALEIAAFKIAQNDLNEAKMMINRELDKWNDAPGTSVVSLYTLQGQIFQEQREYETAWQCFVKAEELGGKNGLSHDQELDLWIRQALCYQELGQYDQAMLLFSKAINRNVVSSQRLRAMFLRAEVYRRQGREELAKKQWEAVALKGGEWGQKAKEKLEEQSEDGD